jgi:hypothetical protein
MCCVQLSDVWILPDWDDVVCNLRRSDNLAMRLWVLCNEQSNGSAKSCSYVKPWCTFIVCTSNTWIQLFLE